MYNTIKPTSSINFQAKLNVTRIKGSHTRWENIAKIFAEKTKKIINDELVLSGSFRKGIVAERSHWVDLDCFLQEKLTHALENLSDSEVAQKLVAIFKFFRKEEKCYKEINRFAESMKLDNYFPIDTQIYDALAMIRLERIKRFKDKNPIFKLGLSI